MELNFQLGLNHSSNTMIPFLLTCALSRVSHVKFCANPECCSPKCCGESHAPVGSDSLSGEQGASPFSLAGVTLGQNDAAVGDRTR